MLVQNAVHERVVKKKKKKSSKVIKKKRESFIWLFSVELSSKSHRKDDIFLWKYPISAIQDGIPLNSHVASYLIIP